MELKVTQEKKVMDLCRNIIPYYERIFFNRYIQDYKDYLWYKWDRAALIADWQTNVSFPLISWMVDTMFASMYDSKLKFNLTGDWLKGTDKILNGAFDYNGEWRTVLMAAIKECIITGKGYVKPYFTNYQEKKMVRWKNVGRIIKRPVFEYKSVFDIFYDYNWTISESPFIIERSIFNSDKIIKKYASQIKKDDPTAFIMWVCANPKIDRYSQYDINRVKHLIAYEDMIKNNKWNISTVIPTVSVSNWTDASTIDSHNNVFAVDFIKNNVYEVIEYTDNDYITVLIDGKLLFSKKRIKDIDWPVIEGISFNEIPWTSDSLWISSMLRDSQMVTNTLYNVYLDNLKMQLSPMYEQVWWMNSILGKSNKIVYEPNKIVTTNAPNSIRKLDLCIPSLWVVNDIQFIITLAKDKVWINDYAMWTDGKVERVASWVDVKINQFKSRLMPLTNSINEAMWKIGKMILMMYANNYKKSELIELGLEWELKLETFIDERNISFQLSSLSLLENEEKLEYLSKNLQTLMWLSTWPDWKPTINNKEIIRAILTKRVDIEAIMKTEVPETQLPAPELNDWTGQATMVAWGSETSQIQEDESLGTTEPSEADLMNLLTNIK